MDIMDRLSILYHSSSINITPKNTLIVIPTSCYKHTKWCHTVLKDIASNICISHNYNHFVYHISAPKSISAAS